MRALFSSLAAAILLACQSPPPKAGEADSTSADSTSAESTSAAASREPAGPGSCAVEPLRAELQSYCELDLGVPALTLAKVGFTGATYHPLATRVITLDQRGLIDPEGSTEPVSVQAWLADPPRRIPEPGELALAIAADVPATTVAELQRGLAAAGRLEVRYLVHASDDQAMPRPRDPQLLTRLGESLPSGTNDKVVFVAQAVQGYAEACPQIAGVFPQLTRVSPGDRCTKLGELAAAAIVECKCPELPTIMTLLYALTVGFEVPAGRAIAIPTVLDPQFKVRPEPGATWGQVAAAQFEDTDLHRLWIDAPPPASE